MKQTIIQGLRKLEEAGASFIAMPCNSAHLYFDELKNSIRIPLLNIVEETVNCLPGTKQRITIFATETTFKSGLYQKGIAAASHEFVFLEHWQAKVNNIIGAIKMKKGRELVVSLWRELIDEIKGRNIEGIVIACTDLSTLNSITEPGLHIYDSAEALAKSAVKRYLE